MEGVGVGWAEPLPVAVQGAGGGLERPGVRRDTDRVDGARGDARDDRDVDPGDDLGERDERASLIGGASSPSGEDEGSLR